MPVDDLIEKLSQQQTTAQQNLVAMTPPFKLGQGDKPKSTSIINTELAIEYDPLLQGAFAYNEFTWEVEITRDVPELHIKKGQMLDAYTSLILAELEHVWDVTFADRAMEHGITALSREQSHNPLTDYLEHCEDVWDGKERLTTFMHTFLGVSITEITTLITKLWAVGACAKAFDPTTKFDYVLDLVGGQGAGKTTLLEKLASGFYTDQFQDYTNKDGYSAMLRAWIVNDDEMTATANSTFEELKKFISARTLEFRPAYGHTSIRRDKGFVMARTTNETTYLKDKTGERRFLPLLVDKQQQQKHPFTDLTPDTVQQFWGEAMHLYRQGFSFELTPEQDSELNEHRREFMYIDAVEDAISEVLDTWTGSFITSAEIGQNIGVPDLIKDKSTARKINYIMNNRDGWEKGASKATGTAKRGWRKK